MGKLSLATLEPPYKLKKKLPPKIIKHNRCLCMFLYVCACLPRTELVPQLFCWGIFLGGRDRQAVPLLFRSLLLLGKWEDPKKASQKGELFESSVIQKRPFNVRAWGSAGENVAGIAVNYSPPPKKRRDILPQREKSRTFPQRRVPSREAGGKVRTRGGGGSGRSS